MGLENELEQGDITDLKSVVAFHNDPDGNKMLLSLAGKEIDELALEAGTLVGSELGNIIAESSGRIGKSPYYYTHPHKVPKKIDFFEHDICVVKIDSERIHDFEKEVRKKVENYFFKYNLQQGLIKEINSLKNSIYNPKTFVTEYFTPFRRAIEINRGIESEKTRILQYAQGYKKKRDDSIGQEFLKNVRKVLNISESPKVTDQMIKGMDLYATMAGCFLNENYEFMAEVKKKIIAWEKSN